MTDTASHRSFFLAATLIAAGLLTPVDAGAQLNLGPVIDRSISLSVPEGRRLRGLPGQYARSIENGQRLAEADCSGAAAQAAADSGGQVLSVSSRQEGDRTVCVVTVLVPGQDGGRPRKRTITIPQ